MNQLETFKKHLTNIFSERKHNLRTALVIQEEENGFSKSYKSFKCYLKFKLSSVMHLQEKKIQLRNAYGIGHRNMCMKN